MNTNTDVQKVSRILSLLDAADAQRSTHKAWKYAEQAAGIADDLGVQDASAKLGTGSRPQTNFLRTALKIHFGV